MYNVRIFKYPSGWQVRVYSRPVGFCDDGGARPPSPVAHGAVWDDDSGEWEEVRYNPLRQAVEPFTFQLATRVPEDESPGSGRSAASSLSRTRNRVGYLSRSNLWDWFFTLTFNPDLVDSADYGECVRKLKSWLDSVKRKFPGMKYIVVPEKHKSGRFHFHGLFAGCDGLEFEDSGHRSGKDVVYNIGRYGLGWSTATKVLDNARATQYICKYITKDLCVVSRGRKRYWASRNLDEADVEEYLVEGSEIPSYVESLESSCQWSKTVEGLEVTVGIYEVGVPSGE